MQCSAFGIKIDTIGMKQAIQKILDWVDDDDGRCRYVVTPNVDHIVKLQSNEQFREAYAAASLALIDGKPVLFALSILGKAVNEIVPGSDLVPELFNTAQKRGGLKVFLLGAAPGVTERAADKIEKTWPSVKVVGYYSPPFGFEKDESENEKIIELIKKCSLDILLIGLGAPKQELWIFTHKDKIKSKVALCVGATIDFLAGEKNRAPRWMRMLAMEWVHRMLSEPSRLLKRYAYDAWLFPVVFWKEWRSKEKR